MSKAFVICRHTGEYSDYSMQVVFVAKSKSSAEAKVKNIANEQERRKAAYAELCPIAKCIKEENPYSRPCPNPQTYPHNTITPRMDYSDPRWKVTYDIYYNDDLKWRKEVRMPTDAKRAELLSAAAKVIARTFTLPDAETLTDIGYDNGEYTIEETDAED
jgi:hypothetical protein